jgi:hypothetical protein
MKLDPMAEELKERMVVASINDIVVPKVPNKPGL